MSRTSYAAYAKAAAALYQVAAPGDRHAPAALRELARRLEQLTKENAYVATSQDEAISKLECLETVAALLAAGFDPEGTP